MLPRRIIILLAEFRESLRMALSAVAAHKLRSGLTLLGVLVGVFSIIVVMTALRVMQSTVEAELSQLGDQTFTVRKYPIILFSVPEGIEKIRRRKNITLQQGRRLMEGVTLARSIGIEAYFWAGQIQTRYRAHRARCPPLRRNPRQFPRPQLGRAGRTRNRRRRRRGRLATSACSATASPRPSSPRCHPSASG